MGFTKFTVSENITVVDDKRRDTINQFLKQANKQSVEELSQEEKDKLDQVLRA